MHPGFAEAPHPNAKIPHLPWTGMPLTISTKQGKLRQQQDNDGLRHAESTTS